MQRVFKYSLFCLFILCFSFAIVEAGCTSYCCGGQDGLGAPNPGPNQTSNKATACTGSNSSRWICSTCNCKEGEKGYSSGSSRYCCSPYYQICDACAPKTSCECEPPFTNTYSPQYGQPRTYDCSDGCGGTTSSQCWCTRDCSLPDCPAGTSTTGNYGTYGVYSCNNECGKSLNKSCYCTSPCTPSSCPSGTTEAITGDYYSNYSCNNLCGKYGGRNCYCSICSLESCLSMGYSDTDLGQGQVPSNLVPSCRNGNENTPDWMQLCDIRYNTCYCSSCSKQCPTPFTNTGNPNLILNDFRECTNDCSVKPPEDQDDCYEVESPQPTEGLVIDGSLAQPNDFGFLSLTHTGDNKGIAKQGDLNDPLSPIKMIAEYRDDNGAGDIEGLFVWFRENKYSGNLGTPLYLSEKAIPKTSANDSWGFMLRRDGSGWKPYVPSYIGETSYWTKVQYLNTPDIYMTFFIIGPNGENMVKVTIPTKPEERSTDGKNVIMIFDLSFSDANGNLYDDFVSEGEYHVYLMGLDEFSFTPYDNYDINYGQFWTSGFKYYGYSNLSAYWKQDQLRYKEGIQTYARDWYDTGKTWTIDRTGPYIDTFAFGAPNGNKLEVHWNVSDDRGLYAVVGNIYTTGGALAREIELSSNDPKNQIHLFDPGSVLLFHDPNRFIPSSVSENNDVGEINGNWAFKVGPDPLAASSVHSIYIDVGDNTTGFFEIHLTVFDDAGNYTSSKIDINIADWFATAGGVAYSEEGTSFSTKDFVVSQSQSEPPLLPYPSTNPGLQFGKADYSSELWAQKSNKTAEELVRSNLVKSYNIPNYLGYKLTSGYYKELKLAYEGNKTNFRQGDLREIFPSSPVLSGSLLNICESRQYCMFDYSGNLDITNNVACDNRSVIFVAGDLNINSSITNNDNRNGCIFVVNGNVVIEEGKDMSKTSFGYDIIHGDILADGQIIIEDEGSKRAPNMNSVIDGVYINGGLSSSYKESTSIVINRYLRVEEKLTYPVLVIDYHPKYGVIAEKLFGRKMSIKPVEVGVKP